MSWVEATASVEHRSRSASPLRRFFSVLPVLQLTLDRVFLVGEATESLLRVFLRYRIFRNLVGMVRQRGFLVRFRINLLEVRRTPIDAQDAVGIVGHFYFFSAVGFKTSIYFL